MLCWTKQMLPKSLEGQSSRGNVFHLSGQEECLAPRKDRSVGEVPACQFMGILTHKSSLCSLSPVVQMQQSDVHSPAGSTNETVGRQELWSLKRVASSSRKCLGNCSRLSHVYTSHLCCALIFKVISRVELIHRHLLSNPWSDS